MFKIHGHSTKEKDYFFYWRNWLYFGNGPYIATDFLLGSKDFSISFGRGSRSFKFHLSIPFLFSFWISFKKVIWYGKSRELSLRFHGGSFWCNLWTEPMDGKTHVFHLVDKLIGRATHSERIIEERYVMIPMPEKSYKGKAKLFESTWKYPRWFSKSVKRVSIDMEEGEQIPHEGKGTCAHNCGRDATFSMTTSDCRSIGAGVGQMVGSILETRVKNGGWSDWTWNKSN